MKQAVSSRLSAAAPLPAGSGCCSPSASASCQDRSRAPSEPPSASGSMLITSRTPGVVPTAGSSCFARRSFDTTAAAAPLCARRKACSRVVLVVYAGTVMPPAAMIARSAISHSGRFSETSSTRSPRARPWARRHLARNLTSSATRRHDQGR